MLVQQAGSRATCGVDAGGVGDQADAFPGDPIELLVQQGVDSKLEWRRHQMIRSDRFIKSVVDPIPSRNSAVRYSRWILSMTSITASADSIAGFKNRACHSSERSPENDRLDDIDPGSQAAGGYQLKSRIKRS